MRFGDFDFEVVDGLRALVGILGAGERQHLRQMDAVGVARGGERLVVAQIIVAIRHAETGRREADHIDVRVLCVGPDAVAEQAVTGAARRGHRLRHFDRRLQMREVVEIVFRRCEAARIDLLGVDERVVEIAQLLFFRRQRRVGLGFDIVRDIAHPLFAEDQEILERARAGAVGRDFRRLEPVAVHIEEEVVAGLHALVHAREVDAPRAERRLCRAFAPMPA